MRKCKWNRGRFTIPKSTYLGQAARAARADPKAALRARVRASFEASGGACGAESVTADLRSGPGAAVSWRDLEPGDASTPVIASEKVVRAIMAEEGLVPRKAAQMARRARYSSYAGELSGVSVNLFFTSFAKQARRSRKGGFTGCANVFSPIPVTA